MSSARSARVREYLASLEAGEAGESLARFFTPDARQIEFPNRLNPDGAVSDLPTLIRRSLQGRALLSAQRYSISNLVESESSVAVEAEWTGTLAVPVAGLASGAVLRAHFAMFFEFRGDLIHRQRNYDCFAPW